MVLSTALFDRPPFLNAIGHGVVVDENGSKLSKRLNNYPAPDEVWNKFGADALRWFLVSSPILRGQNLVMDRDGSGIDASLRQVIVPLWNSVYFFTLYCNIEDYNPSTINDSELPIDRYILSKTHKASNDVRDSLSDYDITGACNIISEFIETLNNWYIRRSRNRFWDKTTNKNARDAYDTLYTVLNVLLKFSAPLIPLISEKLYMNLNDGKSVHLEDWPDVEELILDNELISNMDKVRKIVSSALSIRKKNKIRVRQPLNKLKINIDKNEWIENYIGLIKEEVNIKEIILEEKQDDVGPEELKINPRTLGPRVGSKVQDCIKLAKLGEWKKVGEKIVVGDIQLLDGEYELESKVLDDDSTQIVAGENIIVNLDLKLDEKLIREGISRDVIRMIQNFRREKGLDVSDFIDISISAEEIITDSVKENYSYICSQVLASKISLDNNIEDGSEKIAGYKININF
jgi:isoleucyl-tRNA synthetase